MKNANQQDIENIRNGNSPAFNTMYWFENDMKAVHCKRNIVNQPQFLNNDGEVIYLFEYADSDAVVFIATKYLSTIPKKQGTPAKPKKPHVKGTKPFVYSLTNIKVGTRVKCRDKKIRTVVKISIGLMVIIYFDDGEKVDGLTGIACHFRKNKQDIVAILDDEYYVAKGKKQEEKEGKNYYEVGDVFEICNCVEHSYAILSQVAPYKYALVNLQNGNRYNDEGEWGFFSHITEEMLLSLCRSGTPRYRGKFNDVFSQKESK